jgi:hypothetical protein
VRSRLLCLGLPLALFAGDALAWGLATHLFYAQYLLLAIPLADAGFRRAALRLPRLVLAGACLPDLALTGRALSTTVFRGTHRWRTLTRVTQGCTCDEERAIALGYASHLLSDIVAHHHFVPESERRIAPLPYATHALCEWAMDHHLGAALFSAPGDVLSAERGVLADFVAQRFDCATALAGRAVGLLAGADRLLRASPLPRLSLAVARGFDRRAGRRFEAYVRETSLRLASIDALLEGKRPLRAAEPARSSLRGDPLQVWQRGRLVLPGSLL